MNALNVKQEMSSMFDSLLEKAKEEGRREALSEFLRNVRALSDQITTMIEEAESFLAEDEEEKEEEGEQSEGETGLTPRALEALDFLLDRKEVSVKDLERHLNCSNAAANLALNELSKTGRAVKTFEAGRAIFRPIRKAA